MLLACRATDRLPPQLRVLVLLVLLCGLGGFLGGCVSTGGDGPVANAQASMSGATIAFDSVDGPPPHVFDGFVNILDSETKQRGLATVSREDTAAYRVRSYMAAAIRGGRTSIAWVWDVYDRDQQRSLRLSGEEQTGRAGRDAWASADAQVLKRIAQAGLTGLGNLVNGTLPPDTSAPAVAPSVNSDRAVASAAIPHDIRTAAAMNSNARMKP